MTGGYLEPVWLALVDDDPATRNSVSWLCDEAGIELNCFENASSFLAALPEDRPVSVLLDYQMPVTNGLEALALIKIRTPHAAILMLTGFGSVPLAMTSVGQGAYTFVEKPFNDIDLLSKIQEGLRLAEDQFVDHLATSGADARLATLTSREREVFDLVAVGHASKVIADRLGLATKTVEVHRSRAMLKLGVTTMADILELAKQGTPAAPA
jgi:FixJ family two-component response regulator